MLVKYINEKNEVQELTADRVYEVISEDETSFIIENDYKTKSKVAKTQCQEVSTMGLCKNNNGEWQIAEELL
ncbi:hypothetical protein P7D15_02145 [Bacillus cereus]|uniref:hypothetical protein n=1 Tax=Bacillus cereus TaxID=1396 RepID=UPI0024074DB5|nr:hypothetical protein [Bacillus cereus]MDF9599218.1 hypothetical protein [Bacillus cereus]MDG1589551.1 hypothetical protein [Bacillus cereus]